MAVPTCRSARDFPEQPGAVLALIYFRDRIRSSHNNLMYRYQGVDVVIYAVIRLQPRCFLSVISSQTASKDCHYRAGSARRTDDRCGFITRFRRRGTEATGGSIAMAKPQPIKQAAPAHGKADAMAGLIDVPVSSRATVAFDRLSRWSTIQLGAPPTLSGMTAGQISSGGRQGRTGPES